MDRLSTVLKHLGLTSDEWASLSPKKQDMLFLKAEAEMRRAAKASAKKIFSKRGLPN